METTIGSDLMVCCLGKALWHTSLLLKHQMRTARQSVENQLDQRPHILPPCLLEICSLEGIPWLLSEGSNSETAGPSSPNSRP